MRFSDTILPLILAPAGTAIAFWTFELFGQRFPSRGLLLLIITYWIWILAIAAKILFVLPVMILVPRMRRPRLVWAGIWGAAVARAFMNLVFAPWSRIGISWLPLALWGAAGGMLCSVLARRSGGHAEQAGVGYRVSTGRW